MRRQVKKVLVRYCGGFLVAGLFLFCGACTGVAPLTDSSVAEQKDQKSSQSLLFLPNSIGVPWLGTSGINVFASDGPSKLLQPVAGNPFGTNVSTITSMVAAMPDANYLYSVNPESIGGVSGFAVDHQNAALKVIEGSPFDRGGSSTRWIAIHPSGELLFRVNDIPFYKSILRIYRINSQNGVLERTRIGDEFPISSAGPMAFDPQGRFLFLANNITHAISSYSVDLQSETLKLNEILQTDPYPHSPTVLGKFLYVPTRGGIYAYEIEEQGQLTIVPGSPFSTGESVGDIAASPGGRHLFTIDGLSRRLSSLVVDSNSGQLLETTGSPLFLSDPPFSLAVTPDGERLYVQTCTNLQIKPVRSKILAYSINQTTGSLSFEHETETPQDSCAYNMVTVQK